VRGLAGRDLLTVWEAGSVEGRVQRPLTALRLCFPELTHDELAGLPVGDRDALMFAVHAATFGPQLECLARCPQCQESVEFTLGADALPDAPAPRFEPPEYRAFEVDGRVLEYRLPDSRDLAAASTLDDAAEARALLAMRCVRDLEGSGGASSDMPEGVIVALSMEIAKRQPWADIQVALACPTCGASWDSALDLSEFVWGEISAEARRLAREVHSLARAYGWAEADILAMTPARRRTYLALLG
jgi:hypothetical protein